MVRAWMGLLKELEVGMAVGARGISRDQRFEEV